MDNYTIFTKTAKGLGETLGKTKNLSREQRKILKEIDGKASLGDLIQQIGMDEPKLQAAIAKLLADDYIREFGSSAPPEARAASDTVFGLTMPAKIEAANSQLTIGDFFRAMEQPQSAGASLDFRNLAQADDSAAKLSLENVAAQVEQTRRAIEEEAQRITRQAQQQAADAARLQAEEQTRRAAEEQARLAAEAKAAREAELARQEAAEQARLKAEEQARQEMRAAEEARARAKKAAEEQARREAEEAARRQAEAQAREQAERQARERAEEQARQAAEERARKEAQEHARIAAEQAALEVRRAAEEAARREAEERARQEAAQRERQAAEEAARREAEEQARLQALEAARIAAEARALEEAQAAQERARKEAEEQARRDAEDLVRRQAEEEARRQAEEQAKKEAQEQARIKAREAARRVAEELAKREAEAQAKAEAERLARERAEEEARLAAEERARREAEEQARKLAEEEAQRAAEEQRRLLAEEQAQLAAQEQARLEEERARRAAEALAKKAEQERARQEAEEAARLKAEEKARQKAEEKARKEAEAQAKQQAREQARREAEEKARQEAAQKAQLAAEAKAKKAAEQEARRAAKEQERQAAAEAARLKSEEAARLKAEQAAEKQAQREARDAEKAAAAQNGASLIMLPANFGKLARLGVLALVVMVALGVGLLHVVPFNGRLAQLEKAATAQFRQPVKIGSLNFALLPMPQWRLQQVSIGNEAQITVREVDVRVSPGSLFSDAMQFKAVTLVSPVVNDEGLGWLLFGQTQNPAWQSASLTATDLQLRSQHVQLPAFTAFAQLGEDGGWRKLVLDATERPIRLDLQRADDTVGFELTASELVLPFGGTHAFDTFNASGKVTPDAIEVSKFTAVLYDGTVSGNGMLSWRDGWSLKGEAQARQIALSKLLPALVQSGAMDSSFRYMMQADAAGKLFTSPQAKGNFVIGNGMLVGVDLASLVMGQAGSGRSAFNEMAGDFSLAGDKIQASRLRLSAGLLSATGDAVSDDSGKVEGRFAVDLRTASRQAHATLNLSGTLASPRFSR